MLVHSAVFLRSILHRRISFSGRFATCVGVMTKSCGWMERMSWRGLDHKHEVLRRGGQSHVRDLLLGNAGEEAARLAQPAPLGWWGGANITRLQLAEAQSVLKSKMPSPGRER